MTKVVAFIGNTGSQLKQHEEIRNGLESSWQANALRYLTLNHTISLKNCNSHIAKTTHKKRAAKF